MSAITNIFKDYPNHYFFETGTGLGAGVQMAIEAEFPIIMSIELSGQLHVQTVKKFIEHENVLLFQGDSRDILHQLIEPLEKPITFWLDAHYCGHVSRDQLTISAGKEGCNMIKSELEIIKKHPIKTHTLLIDDMDFFKFEGLEDIIRDINPDYKISYVDGSGKNSILIATV